MVMFACVAHGTPHVVPDYPTSREARPDANDVAQRIFPAIVLVAFDTPCMVDGLSVSSYIGAGIIVDAEAGLVLVDKSTVPIGLGVPSMLCRFWRPTPKPGLRVGE